MNARLREDSVNSDHPVAWFLLFLGLAGFALAGIVGFCWGMVTLPAPGPPRMRVLAAVAICFGLAMGAVGSFLAWIVWTLRLSGLRFA